MKEEIKKGRRVQVKRTSLYKPGQTGRCTHENQYSRYKDDTDEVWIEWDNPLSEPEWMEKDNLIVIE